MPPELTPTRTRLLSLILSLGKDATITRVAEKARVSKAAISNHVTALRTLGYLEESAGRYAPLTLTDRARQILQIGIPIYGQIAAGRPILADQAPDQTTPSLDALLGVRDGDFLLEVRGDSMTGIGVMHGDWVLVRPASTVQDGEVAVVLIPGENTATLKRVLHFHGEVILSSENPDHPRMSFPAEQVVIQGKMIGRVGMVPARATVPNRSRD